MAAAALYVNAGFFSCRVFCNLPLSTSIYIIVYNFLNLFLNFVLAMNNDKGSEEMNHCGLGEIDGGGVDDDTNLVNLEGNFNNKANKKPQTGLL